MGCICIASRNEDRESNLGFVLLSAVLYGIGFLLFRLLGRPVDNSVWIHNTILVYGTIMFLLLQVVRVLRMVSNMLPAARIWSFLMPLFCCVPPFIGMCIGRQIWFFVGLLLSVFWGLNGFGTFAGKAVENMTGQTEFAR